MTRRTKINSYWFVAGWCSAFAVALVVEGALGSALVQGALVVWFVVDARRLEAQP